MKRIIFHIPNKIDPNLASGSQIRPIKMLQAFKNIGYEVDVVMGYARDRKKQIKQIKENIRQGIKYDFLYSESSTMPTALTEKHHLPVTPFLDFNFFRFCKKNNINIGLFYRDIYWNFEVYKKEISFMKRKLAIFFYKYDLHKYNKYLDIMYLPSKEIEKHIPISLSIKRKSLPPAIEKNNVNTVVIEEELVFVYVGGISDLYDLTLFCEVNYKLGMRLNLCTREQEWLRNKKKYKRYSSNTFVYHVKGKELEEVYNKSRIAVYFVKPNIIWNFAMGVKLFEYIAYKKPILAVKGTAVGNFVEENDIGWSIEYTEKALKKILDEIQKNPQIIQEKIKNIEKITPENTWEARAKQVQKDLS